MIHALEINSQANREVIKNIINISPFHVLVLFVQPFLGETVSKQTSAILALTVFPSFLRSPLSQMQELRFR